MKETYYLCIIRTLSIFRQYLKILNENGYEMSDKLTISYIKKLLDGDFKSDILYSIVIKDKKYWIYENVNYESYKKVVVDYSNNNYDLKIIDNMTELYNIVLGKSVNYNEPRKLVYEKNNYNYKWLVFKPSTNEELINAQKISFKFGYSWGSCGKSVQFDSINECGYLFFGKSDKSIFYSHRTEITNMEKYIKDYFWSESYKYVEGIKKFEFNIIDSINYNEPRKLVYENKIIKYNFFRNGIY